jgi:AcrR family transcriptional regulator
VNKKIVRSSTNHDTYQFIIHVSYQLFMELGYRKVSTRMIAEHCGITQPALYHHFKNKQDIYKEVINASIKQTEQALLNITKKFENLQECLYQIAIYFLENYQEDLMQMFHDLQHEMPADVQTHLRIRWQEGFLNPIIQVFDQEEKNNANISYNKIESNSQEIALMFLQYIQTAMQPSYMKELSSNQQKKEIQRKAKLIVHLFLFGLVDR